MGARCGPKRRLFLLTAFQLMGNPMKSIPVFVALAGAASLATTTLAEPLPKDAKPIAAKSLSALYSGNTAKWDNSTAFFAPDGTVKGIFTEENGTRRAYQGEWRTKGNEVCMTVKVLKTDWDASTDCWKWYLGADKQIWTLWSVHYDKTKPTKNDYYTSEKDNISRGDSVSKAFAKLAG